MANLVGVFQMSHTPFCYIPGELWNERRAGRSIRDDVPMDDHEGNVLKYERIQTAFATLREKLAAARPDAVIVLGDDQSECFDFTNHPAFAIYAGEEFEGFLAPRDLNVGTRDPNVRQRATLKGHPQMAVSLLTGLMERNFDPAFCLDMPKPEVGIGHAILRPAESIIPEGTPIVPILLNCYYAPQVTGRRAYGLGKAVREVIDETPGDLRVAVVGSGGLWHAQGNGPAYLDEEFDGRILSYVEKGDASAMADYFDAYELPEGHPSERSRSTTGMPAPGGPFGGSRETCNWIAAAAVAEGVPETVIDYVPVYASPIGVAFAYTESVA